MPQGLINAVQPLLQNKGKFQTMAEVKASYQEQFKVGLYDIDVAGNPKTSRLVERMLLVANNHLDLLNWSWTHLYNDKGVALVLIEVAVKITGSMKLGETATLTTWTAGRTYPMLMRWFVIENEAGERVCESMMNCVLIDVKTRTLTNAMKYGLELFEDETPPREVSIKRPKFTSKVDIDENGADFKMSKTVVCSDLDYNGHMNTARYVELAEDLLGRDWLMTHTIKEVCVRYEKETAYGETIETAGFDRPDEENGGGVIEIAGKAGGVNRFSARIGY